MITTPAHRITSGGLELAVATDFGPRVTSFSLDGKEAFAMLGDLSIPYPDGRFYRLVGGHRLWIAPEEPETTYEPDDSPVGLTADGDALVVKQPAGVVSGIEKTLRIEFVDASVAVQHTLTNRNAESIRIAPWAITQLPVGGTAVLPLPLFPADPEGLQPNAEIVLWPYTGVNDTPFELCERLILVDANRTEATKVGTTLDRQWLAYLRDGLVFVKRARAKPSAEYLDRGAAAQCYCSGDFVELETLGPATTLAPGESTSHDETWQLLEVDPGTSPRDMHLVLGLDEGDPL